VILADLAVNSGDSVRVSPVFGSIWSCGREEAFARCVLRWNFARFARFCSDSRRRDAVLVFLPASPPVGMCFVPWMLSSWVSSAYFCGGPRLGPLARRPLICSFGFGRVSSFCASTTLRLFWLFCPFCRTKEERFAIFCCAERICGSMRRMSVRG